MRVRLVIGIYPEAASYAYVNNGQMKEALLRYAGQLIAKGVYVELATHDGKYIENFVRQVVLPQKVSINQFETQFLYNVPRDKLLNGLVTGNFFRAMAARCSQKEQTHLASLADTGVIVRMYLPFGLDEVAAPYCKRRLKGNPNLISYGIKNLLKIEF
jgi:hypothetical protein